MGYKFAIDRGGTFTDVFVEYPDNTQYVYKLLSEDYHYKDAPSEAIRRLISNVSSHFLIFDNLPFADYINMGGSRLFRPLFSKIFETRQKIQ